MAFPVGNWVDSTNFPFTVYICTDTVQKYFEYGTCPLFFLPVEYLDHRFFNNWCATLRIYFPRDIL